MDPTAPRRAPASTARASCASALLVLAGAAPTAALECEIPVWAAPDPAPNVLVSFDTSTSMRHFPDSSPPAFQADPSRGPDYKALLEAQLATRDPARDPMAAHFDTLHGSPTTAFDDFAIYDAAENKICDRWNDEPCLSQLSTSAQCNLGRAVDDVDSCAAGDDDSGDGCGGGTQRTPNDACDDPDEELAWGKGFALADWDSSDGRESGTSGFTGLDTIFMGRRLNYQRYYRAKDDIAKAALVGVIDSYRENLTWGVMQFRPRLPGTSDSDLGGYLIREVDEADAVIGQILDYEGTVTLSSNLRTVEAWTDSGPMVNCPATPLTRQLTHAYEYFRGEFSNPGSDVVFESPIEEACHESVVVIVTDGQPNRDLGEGDVSSYDLGPRTCGSGFSDSDDSYALDDMAGCMLERGDLSDLLPGDQPLRTYTIGFGDGGGSAFDDLLGDTADNGGGVYIHAGSAPELEQAFAEIANSIVNDRTASGTSATKLVGAGSNLLITASFESGTWRGQLQGYQQPYASGDAPVWDAGQMLEARDPATRRIYAVLDSGDGDGKMDNLVELTAANAGTLTPYMDVGGDATYAAEVIAWTRGTDLAGYRRRDHDDDGAAWKLGDIISSSPVVVGPPNAHYYGTDYHAFLLANAARPPVVYVGTNDGGLRAIDAATGQERWFLIPNFNLPVLKDLASTTYCHLFTMDGTPRVVDAYVAVDGEPAQWRTILVIGSGGTGGYIALDITDPGSVGNPNPPKVMWQWPNPVDPAVPAVLAVPELGRAERTPEIGFEQASVATWPSTTTQWRAMIPSGSDNADGEAYLFDVALQSGVLSSATDIDPGAETENWPTDLALVDVSGDNQFDHAYLATRNGKVWRHEIGGATQLVYDTGRPISSRPVPSFTTTGSGDPNVLLVIGTGEIVERDDVETTDLERLYVLEDNVNHNTGTPGTAAEITLADLTNMTDRDSSITDTPGRGWYIDLKLNAAGEPGSTNDPSGVRVLRPARLARGVIFQTVFDPTDADCNFGGDAYLLTLDLLTGNATDVPVVDQDGDGDVDEDDRVAGSVARGRYIGQGIPERPVLDPTNGTLIIQMGDTTIARPMVQLTAPAVPVRWSITRER